VTKLRTQNDVKEDEVVSSKHQRCQVARGNEKLFSTNFTNAKDIAETRRATQNISLTVRITFTK
jgi:hypothetical protein